MPVKLSSLAVAPNLDGVLVKCPSLGEDVYFLVRPITTRAFVEARNHHVARLRRMHGDKIPDDVLREIIARMYADHILLDWRGFFEYDASGLPQIVPYTKELAFEILSDPKYETSFTAGVIKCADEAATAKIEYVEDVAKN